MRRHQQRGTGLPMRNIPLLCAILPDPSLYRVDRKTLNPGRNSVPATFAG